MAVVAPELTVENLERAGKNLDKPYEFQPQDGVEVEPGRLWQRKWRDGLIEDYLKIRTKTNSRTFLRLNRAQREFSYRCGKQNVVLKARQVGITTYIAARFFAQTISQPGILSMQVTQDRESAEDIFRIVRRFWENLPDEMRNGYLRTSLRNARQLVFPNLDSEYCLASAAENAGRGGRSRICIARKFRGGAETAVKHWCRCGRRWFREARLCWSRRRTEQEDFSTKSGSGRRIRDIRGTFFRGGMTRLMRLRWARISLH